MGDRLAARTDWRIDADRVLAAIAPPSLNGISTGPAVDPDYLPFHPSPSRPRFAVPEGAVTRTAMSSVRRPRFRMRRSASTQPCDAPKEKLFALRDFLGFERNVIVQATCHGK
jgi:hypothetical protein